MIPRIIRMARSSSGSSTLTTWNRRARAASFSKYFLYSAQVVAAIVRSSPRARAGLRRLAASFWPAWPPAPIMVCASSMKRTIGTGEALTSEITCLSRFSNSPLTPAPAWRRARSRVRIETFLSTGGTSPFAIRTASPSTTAVLPTPASPVRIGLFCRRRIRMLTICRTSASRPITASISPFLARSVRLTVNWSRPGVWVTPAGPGAEPPTPVSAAAGPSSSAEPATSFIRLALNTAASILASSREASRASRPSSSSSSSAISNTPERTFDARNWIDASTQASRMSLSIRRESVGVRWLPVRNWSITLVRSRVSRAVSTSKWRKMRVRSVFPASTSLTSQCSTSTLGFVRERQRPAAAWSAFTHVVFNVLIKAAESTPMIDSSVSFAWLLALSRRSRSCRPIPRGSSVMVS